MNKIINIAVVAHVDAGKSTLVDALLKQSHVFHEHETVVDRVMDSNDLERERGITITAKNCSIRYNDYKINIVDTPGHADFSSEIERVIKTVDTVILLVDASEGPMPQTRFVLKEALKNNLKPILFINKIDKKDARPTDVVDLTFDLFLELGASDEQLDFKILYGRAKDGIALYNVNDINDNINPLLETIVNNIEPYSGNEDDDLQLQISNLGYDDYIGTLGIGRVSKGKVKVGEQVTIVKNNGGIVNSRISKLFVYEGIKRVEVKEALYGDIVIIAGLSGISIGDTINSLNKPNPLPKIEIDSPTLSMNFYPNTSPFAGKTGKFLTSRHIKERLEKEMCINVGLIVEEIPGVEGYKVSGRGELHLSILIENMRREGYELSVSKPEVIFKLEDDKKLEPYENVILSIPNEYSGTIINDLNERKGKIVLVSSKEEGYTYVEYLVPTRGLLGYRGNFITNTKGEGIMVRSFAKYDSYAGEIMGRKNGVLVSMVDGVSFAYSLFHLTDRGTMIIDPGTDVYVGMIIGIHNRDNDLDVNPCKNKEMTNIRSAASDDAIALNKARAFTLETALEFIADDEMVEVTPTEIRLRKRVLDPKHRKSQ